MVSGVFIVAPESGSIVPPKVIFVIKEISDIVPEDFPNKLPPIYDTPHTIEPGSDKFTFQLGEVDSDTDKEITGDDISLNCIRPTPSTHLSVVRRVPSQPAEKDDWKRTAIFQTFSKIGDKNYGVIVDSESCINAILSKVIENLELDVVPHFCPNKVSWINSMAISVQQLSLVLIEFHLYFWKTMWHMLGIKSKFSTAFQP